MIIRTATKADAAQIADLWNRMIRDTLLTFTTEEKTVQAVAQLIALRIGAFWVADVGGVDGFVTFGPFRGGPGYSATVEHSIVLGSRAQGKGIGRALMQQAMAQAHTQGHHIMVAAISSANPAAVKFHTALGFVQTGQMPQVGRKAGQWLDLILMQKTLGAP